MKYLVCLALLFGCNAYSDVQPQSTSGPVCICVDGMDKNCKVCYPDKEHTHDDNNEHSHH